MKSIARTFLLAAGAFVLLAGQNASGRKGGQVVKTILLVTLGLVINVSISYGTTLTFKPKGAQLDADKNINDIRIAVGEMITFEIILNTTGLKATEPLLDFHYDVEFDPTELKFVKEKIDVTDVFAAFVDAPMHTPGFTHFHSGGAIGQGKTLVLDEITFEVLKGLNNDGKVDFELDVSFAQVLTAPPVNFKVITDKFISTQTVEVQPIPEPSTMLLLGSGLAGLGWYRRRRKAA